MFYDILLGIALLVFLFFGLAWYLAGKVIKQPRELHNEEWAKYSLWPQPISFSAEDGMKLSGVFIQGQNKATVILLHGYGRSKEQMLPQADLLNKAGYNIFIFDFRASGESDGKYITFGQREQYDLSGAVNYLKTRSDVDINKIGLLGFSMGGAVAIMKSGELPEIKAIVISSTFMRFKTVIWNNFKEYLKGLPFFPLGYLVIWVIKFRTGIYYPKINPINYIHKLKSRPLMVIHGEHDKKIPVSEATEFLKAAPWLKEYWVAKNAGHDDLLIISHQEYKNKILSFFNQYLLNT